MLWKQTGWVVTCTWTNICGRGYTGQNDRRSSATTKNLSRQRQPGRQWQQTSRDRVVVSFFKA